MGLPVFGVILDEEPEVEVNVWPKSKYRCIPLPLSASSAQEDDFWGRTPEDSLVEKELHRDVEKVLKTLQPREEHVVRLRIGLGVARGDCTLSEVAAVFKVGRERVRQIEAKALRKLRHPSRAKRLWSYLGYPTSHLEMSEEEIAADEQERREAKAREEEKRKLEESRHQAWLVERERRQAEQQERARKHWASASRPAELAGIAPMPPRQPIQLPAKTLLYPPIAPQTGGEDGLREALLILETAWKGAIAFVQGANSPAEVEGRSRSMRGEDVALESHRLMHRWLAHCHYHQGVAAALQYPRLALINNLLYVAHDGLPEFGAYRNAVARLRAAYGA